MDTKSRLELAGVILLFMLGLYVFVNILCSLYITNPGVCAPNQTFVWLWNLISTGTFSY